MMNGVDALVFTAGIGENQRSLREDVCAGMDFFGIAVDSEKNQQQGPVNISKDGAKVQTWVVPTDEEYMIAIDTQRLASH